MTNFTVIEKDSLNKVSVNAQHITLNEASIVHTKMHRNDVSEFLRDGNNLILKLTNGETIVIENFFVTYDKVESDLVFEEDGCVLYWFDGVSGFKGIPGLEVLLPAAASGGSLLPWIIGGGAIIGGAIAALDDDDDDKTPAPKVAVTGYYDNVAGGIENANVADKGLTNDNKPVLSGTVENGKTVEVFIDGISVGTAIVNSDGTWSLPELATALTDGTHTITAKVTGPDGQTATSNEYVITVDTTVSAGEPELVKGVDGTDTITTKVDPKDVISKDDIKLVDKDGNEIPDTTVTLGEDGTVTITGKDIPEDAQVQVTDKVGNTDKSPVTDVTPELGRPTIEISTDGNNDAYLSGTELGSSETVNTVVGLPEGTKAGDIVTVKDQTGKEYPHTVTVDEATAGKSTVAVDRPAEGSELKVTATVTNGAGTSPSSDADSAVVDTTTSAGKPELVKGVDGNDTITTKVDPKDVISKDDIKLVDKDGNKIPVTDVTLGDDGTVTITGENIPLDAKVVVTDKVGNTAEATPENKTPSPTVAVTGYYDDVAGGIVDENVPNTGLTNDNKPVLSGTVENGKTVEVFIDGNSVGTATVNSDGTWSLPELATALTDGTHTITAKVTGPDGQTATSNEYVVTVDTVVIIQDKTTDDHGPEFVLNSGDTITVIAKVITSDPGSTVQILDSDDKEIGKGTVDETGQILIKNIDVTKVSNLEDLKIKVIDKAGNTDKLKLQEANPPIPVITIDSGDDDYLNNDEIKEPVLVKITVPTTSSNENNNIKDGDKIIVKLPEGIVPVESPDYIYDPATQTITFEGKKDQGTYTFEIDPDKSEYINGTDLQLSSHVERDVDGITATSQSTIDTTKIDTVVDAGEPELVKGVDGNDTITTKVDPEDVISKDDIKLVDKDGNPLDVVVTLGDDGTVTITGEDIPLDAKVVVTDKVGNTTEVTPENKTPAPTVAVTGYYDNVAGGIENANVADKGLTNDNKPVLSGTVENGKTVEVFIDGNSVGTATVNSDGTWSLPELTTALTDGTHTIIAKVTGADGQTATSNEYVITVDTTVSAGEPELVKGVDGNDTITTKVDPKDVISKDDIKLVDKDGNEIPDTTVTLGDDGTVTITGENIPLDAKVVVTDKVGNTAEATPENKTPAPTVAVTGYYDNVAGGIENANVADKGLTNDNKPVLSGTVENGKTVEVFIDGNSVGTATVNSDGTWSLPELTTALTDGTHTITAKVTGADGQEVTSNEYAVTVDTTVSAGEPELVKGVDGTDTITTKVDPEDVISKDDIKLVDKDGNEIPDTTVTLGDDGTVTITGEDIPLDAQVQVTDKVGNTDSQPLSYLASDDFNKMDEDSGTISGTVLTNDKLGSIVTGFVINGTSYNAGQEATIADVGKVTIAADGKYSFTPVKDYSGDVPAITYTVSNDSKVDSANLKIEVVAVADQPSTGTFELDPPALSLNMQTWTNVKIINGHNLLKNGGDGASNEDLIAAIDYLRSHESVKNDGNNTDVIYDEPSKTTSLEANTLATYKAVYISGYVFLEAGQTYLYSGAADDSATIVIGDGVSSLHVNWKGTSTSGNGEFSVTETGYYTFQFYAHNADNVGNYHFSVNNADGSNMKYYPDLSAIEASLQGSTYLLGDYNAGEDGKNDTGFYPVSMGYSGVSSNDIALTGINPKVTDTDGSEYLSFVMDGLPVGAILTFKDANGFSHEVIVDSSGKASWSPVATDQGTSEYTDFVLNLDGANQDSNLNVTLTVTSTEKSNGDNASSTLQFEVEVTDGLNKTVIAKAGNDTISTGDTGHDTVIYNVLDAADAKAGHGTDTWTDFGLGNTDDTSSGYDSNADTIKFSADFFDGLLADKSNISEYINVNTTGTTTTISVDRDGADNGTNYLDLLVLTNQTTDVTLQTLLDNHQIIIG